MNDKITVNFVPQTIALFRFNKEIGDIFYIKKWGDPDLLHNTFEYFSRLVHRYMLNNDCEYAYLFIKDDTLEYHIIGWDGEKD